MKLLSQLTLVLLGLLATACSTTRPVLLSDLDQGLRPYQMNPEYDGILDRVTWEAVGKPAYDQVFLETARILALYQHLNFALDRVEKTPESLWNKSVQLYQNSLKLTEVRSVEDLKNQAVQLLPKANPVLQDALYPLLTVGYTLALVPRTLGSIERTLTALTKLDPLKDFSGPDALRLPALRQALLKAQQNLQSTQTQLQQLPPRATRLAGKILAATLNPAPLLKQTLDAAQNLLKF